MTKRDKVIETLFLGIFLLVAVCGILSGIAHGQTGNTVVTGASSNAIPFVGTPTGGCSATQTAVNTNAGGHFYKCDASTPPGSWVDVGPAIGLADPGGNGVVFRDALNHTVPATFTNIVNAWASGSCTGFLDADGTCFNIVISGSDATFPGQVTAVKVITNGAGGGTVAIAGATSGTTTLQAQAAALGIVTLPAATDTLAGKATTDVFTNKTIDTAGAGNQVQIGGKALPAAAGTANQVLAMDGTAANIVWTTSASGSVGTKGVSGGGCYVGGGGSFTAFGSQCADVAGGIAGNAVPTAFRPDANQYTTSTSGVNIGVADSLTAFNYRIGFGKGRTYKFPYPSTSSAVTQRCWFGLTDQTPATMLASDAPAGNYIMFRYSTTVPDAAVTVITQGASTAGSFATTYTNLQATATTAGFFAIMDDVPNSTFRIFVDFVDVHDFAYGGTNVPASGTNVHPFQACQDLANTALSLFATGWAWEPNNR